MKAITDTGFLVAFADKRDPHHAWAMALAKDVTDPLLTCEAVLAETAFHLEDSATTLAMVTDGLVSLAFNVNEHVPLLSKLAKRYADRKPDLADLCLIRMSELFPRYLILTVDDADFHIYRRNGREVIPIVTPTTRSGGSRRRG